MTSTAQNEHSRQPRVERRASQRKRIAVPGRIVWRDTRGTTRFASVLTRDVSSEWAFVECLSGPPIPLYRLVHLQLDQAGPARDELPASLRHGKVLSAVYRVAPSESRTGLPQGYVLRLLAEPGRRAAAMQTGLDQGVDETAEEQGVPAVQIA